MILRQPAVRRAFKLPAPPSKNTEVKPKKKKGLSGFRESKINDYK